MSAIYAITRFLTFPGAAVRAMWEHLICKICGVPVEDNRTFRFDEMCSHIEHELMPKAGGAFAISFVPAFFNGILAFLLCIGPMLGLFAFEMSGTASRIVYIVAYWFAFSLYVNSYPTVEDALNMKEKVYKHGNIAQKIFYSPGFLGCFVGAYLEKYCVTFLLAAAALVVFIIKM